MSIFLWFCFIICFLAGPLVKCIEEDDEDCVYIDNICLNSWEVANYEAIRTLHAHLDDDHNGDIDLSESVDFLREELNYTKEAEKRQNFFHPNNDHHISVGELWTMWLDSEVHNWTVDNTVSWLCLSVDLFQYAELFKEHGVNGSLLPRLARSSDHFLTRTLGIKNPSHRSKISIKAMDVVLFGPPKDTGSYLKDITIVLLITFLIIGAFRFYHVQKDFDRQRSHMIQEMESLNAEEKKFREELQLRNGDFSEENDNSSVNEAATEETSQAETESSCIKWGLDFDFEGSTTSETNRLQMWLQLSYEREKAAFECKCQLVKAQVREAKDMCDKLHSSKKQFFATLGLVHGKTEPKYDAITEAVRDSIADIKLLHKELDYRWNSIEKLTGCELTNNAGLTHLEFLLEPEIHCPSKSSASTVGDGFKNANVGRSKRKKDNRSSPETESIKSSSSLPTQNSTRSVNSLQQSHTIASALGNNSVEIDDGTKGSKSALDGQQVNHSPMGISSTPSGSNSQLISSEPKKDTDVSGPSEAVDSNPSGNAILPQVRRRIKPFFKSYSQDADEEWPRIVGGKNDSKFKSEPSLETDGSVVSETPQEPTVNGAQVHRWKRGSKFLRSKIFKLRSKTEKFSKLKETT